MALDLDPGTAALGNPRLIEAIIEEMAGGAIPFERFMELALYHPEHGYYRKPGRVGRQGDFLTSPTIHPMFGWAVAGWCRSVWEQLGRPAEFMIFEPGAGEGALAKSILDWAEGKDAAFRAAIRYLALEPNSPGSDDRVEWLAAPPETIGDGVVVSNELFDAFPVRLFEVGGRGPVEMLVRWDGERFVETPGGVASIDDAPAIGAIRGEFTVLSRDAGALFAGRTRRRAGVRLRLPARGTLGALAHERHDALLLSAHGA